jgi:AcrR family transcriptional regulator
MLRQETRSPKSRTTVNGIVVGAARVLVEEGYARMTFERVAKVAGTSTSAVYRYFRDRRALVGYVALDYRARARRLLEETGEIERLVPRAAVDALLEALLRIESLDPPLAKILREQVPRDKIPCIDDLDHDVERLVRRVVGALRPDNQATVAFVVARAAHHLTQALLAGPSEERQLLREELRQLLLRYLC